jgi:hypothetical protein
VGEDLVNSLLAASAINDWLSIMLATSGWLQKVVPPSCLQLPKSKKASAGTLAFIAQIILF